MTADCSLNYKFSTWKFQAQTWEEHVVYRNCFWQRFTCTLVYCQVCFPGEPCGGENKGTGDFGDYFDVKDNIPTEKIITSKIS